MCKVCISYPAPSLVDDRPYFDITRYHFSTVIDDVEVRLVNDYEEASSYVLAHPYDKAILFYDSDNISPEDHQSLQTKTFKIQLYSITNRFNPANFIHISESLFPIYSIIYATSILSNFQKLNDEQQKMASSLLREVRKLQSESSYISPIILKRCELVLTQMLNK